MHPITRSILLLVMFCLFSLTHAQSPNQTSTKSNAGQQSSIASVENAELTLAKQQIKLLENQLQSSREFQGNILDTVYWALSGIFLVVSLLLGFGWLANFKVYERDKDSLKAELMAVTSTALSKMTDGIEKHTFSLEQAVKTKSEASAAEILKSVGESISKAIKPIRISLDSMDVRLFRQELIRLKEKMESNNSDSMALTDALSLLELCRNKDEDEVPDVIKFISKKLDSGGKFTASEITSLNKIIDLLPSHYKALTDRLRPKLVASDIF